ncbi:hypothetical protein, partial [Streptomyces chryseus]|uniref:hypothetical protein n=1 Tax=Streptomyces chryseus TaxID=68186 RepID=UPI001B8844E1
MGPRPPGTVRVAAPAPGGSAAAADLDAPGSYRTATPPKSKLLCDRRTHRGREHQHDQQPG